MESADLLALAERCEKADGPSMDLDCLIWCATSPSPFEYHGGEGVLAVLGGFAARLDWKDMPHPTASLDAALTLVPEGHRWAVEAFEGLSPRGWCSRGFQGSRPQSVAATPALALCAAALRARSTP